MKQHLVHILKPSFRSLLFLLAAGMLLFSCEEEKEAAPSSEASVTSLTLTIESIDYAITFTNKQGKITVPYATAFPATATVKAVQLSAKAKGVKVGDDIAIPVSGTVTLTVTAEDDKTTGVYTLTVEKAPASTEASITSLTLTVADMDYEIMFEDRAYTLILPAGSTLPTAVDVKEIALSAGAASDAENGTSLTVTDNTVRMTVTAEDGETTQEYTVNLLVAASVGASITSLTLTVAGTDYEVTFEGTRGRVTLPYGTAIPAEVGVKEITLSDGAESDAENELTVTDNMVMITVTAEDGETESAYTVTFSVAANSEASVTSFTLTVGDTDYEITFEDRQDTIVLPYGTSVPTGVGVKEITLSAGATGVADDDELTVTDNAVTLTVTAEDGETTNTYTVRLVVSVGITLFTFEVAANESMALDAADRQRIEGTINQQDGTITFDEQSAYIYRDKLKATFEVSEAGAAVQVDGADQTSGVTEQDFRSPVSYVVRAQDGTETTYTVTLTKSKLATIPNAQFRARLKVFFPAAFTDDQLNIAHSDIINNSDELNVKAQNPKLTSLKGIEFFTALTYLNCNQNALTSLDVTKNTALTYLYCAQNAFASLDVSKNTILKSLSCSNNRLKSLDVNKNTALTYLDCESNALDSLDVHANMVLVNLYCHGNNLVSLDMTGIRSVENLDIGTGTEEDNLLEMLRVNTAVQDRQEVITMKQNRGAALTVTTVNNEGTEVCADYTPAQGGGTCN